MKTSETQFLMTFMFMHLRNGAVDADAPRETPLREGRNCGVGSAFLFLLFSVRHTRAIFAFQGAVALYSVPLPAGTAHH